MRIVYCSNRYWPAQGGLEIYLRNIVQELSKSHTVTVVTLVRDERCLFDALQDSSPPIPVSEDLSTIITTLKLSWLRRLALNAIHLEDPAQRLLEGKYHLIRSLCVRYTALLLSSPLRALIANADVIHSMGPWELSHAVNLVKSGIPHVVTGFLHQGHWADDRHSLKHFNASDHIVALSRTEQLQYEHLGIPVDRITVVGVPSNSSTPYSDAKTTTGLCDLPSRFVLFLGVKRDYKGLDLLLSAAPHVWRVFPDVGFVFAGPRTEYSRRLFQSAPVDSRIIELDTVSETDKVYLLRTCRVLCLPSATEIMPNVILESWMQRKPVVTLAIPTLCELVSGAGLLVGGSARELSEAIVYLINNPDIANALGDQGWSRCKEEHDLEMIGSQLEAVYRRAIGTSRRSLERGYHIAG